QKEGEEKTTTAAASTGDAAKGEAIFQENCEFYHDAKSNETRVGPGLKGVLKELPESHTTSEGTEHTAPAAAFFNLLPDHGYGVLCVLRSLGCHMAFRQLFQDTLQSRSDPCFVTFRIVTEFAILLENRFAFCCVACAGRGRGLFRLTVLFVG
ncbi:MAG: hypothetical protein O7E51_00970, partial [Acidobacteria bacterium]|nr:hypothetical protein [Acidobacteriota bacterium]